MVASKELVLCVLAN